MLEGEVLPTLTKQFGRPRGTPVPQLTCALFGLTRNLHSSSFLIPSSFCLQHSALLRLLLAGTEQSIQQTVLSPPSDTISHFLLGRYLRVPLLQPAPTVSRFSSCCFRLWCSVLSCSPFSSDPDFRAGFYQWSSAGPPPSVRCTAPGWYNPPQRFQLPTSSDDDKSSLHSRAPSWTRGHVPLHIGHFSSVYPREPST